MRRAAVRLKRFRHPITAIRKSIHWLKVPERIHVKVLSQSFSTSGHFSSQVLQPSHIHHSTTSIGMTCHLNLAPFLYLLSLLLHCQRPITNYHLYPAPLSLTSRGFHSKLKGKVFKNSYSDSSDFPSSILAVSHTSLRSKSDSASSDTVNRT